MRMGISSLFKSEMQKKNEKQLKSEKDAENFINKNVFIFFSFAV